jgi:hypothetical protein
MSVKLVPVWSVTIEPRLIGVPVAATPGLVPHDEVPVALAVVLEVGLALVLVDGALLLEDALVVGALDELLGLLLLLHPARTPPIAMTATAAPASRERRCSYPFMGSAFSWLTAIYFRTVRCVALPAGKAACAGGQTKSTWLKRLCFFVLPLHCVR